MIELAREAADGMLSYLVTPAAHRVGARRARSWPPALRRAGDPASRDPVEARRIARERTSWYFDLGNYPPSLRAPGLQRRGSAHSSDRIIDGLVAWGDAAAIAERVGEHLAAGADHVCLQALPTDDDPFALAALRELAQRFSENPAVR